MENDGTECREMAWSGKEARTGRKTMERRTLATIVAADDATETQNGNGVQRNGVERKRRRNGMENDGTKCREMAWSGKEARRDEKRRNEVQRNGTERKRSRNGTENGAEWRGKGTKNEKDVEVEAERL